MKTLLGSLSAFALMVFLGACAGPAEVAVDDTAARTTNTTTTTTTTSSTDNDYDGDGVADATDNCYAVSNSSQADANGNGVGDACESTDTTTTDPDTENTCVGLDAPTVVRDDGFANIEQYLSFIYSSAPWGITGVGVTAEGDRVVKIYVELKKINNDGTVDESSLRSYSNSASGHSNDVIERFIALPAGFVATGFGFASDSTGSAIEVARIQGVRLNASGVATATTESIVDRNGNSANGGAVSLRSDSPSLPRYNEYDVPSGSILTGLGLAVNSAKVSHLWAKASVLNATSACR